MAEAMYEPSENICLKSRLSPTFEEVLHDSDALGHLVQFMEGRDDASRQLIRFWIQAQCYKDAKRESDPNHTENQKKDAIKIFNRFIRKGSMHCLEMDDYLRDSIATRLADDPISNDLFSEAQDCVLRCMDETHSQEFFKSSLFLKYQIDVLTRSGVILADLIFSDSTLFYFIEFMEQENMRRYIDFLLVLRNFKAGKEDMEDARVLFKRFFCSGSKDNLQFSDTIVCQMDSDLKQGLVTCFDVAAGMLLQYLEKTYFRQFIESQTYISFLTEKINSFQNTTLKSQDFSHVLDLLETQSTAGDTISSACEDKPTDSSPNSKERSTSLSPLNFWTQGSTGKKSLQIAHVDPYGKVTSHLEPDPGKMHARSSTLSQAMVRILGKDDEETKQNLAWRVAEMIVNDVTRVTQDYP